MNLSTTLAVTAAAALSGSVLVAGPAHASTEQCDRALYPHKVELGGVSTSASTGLLPDVPVCIKAGTRTVVVFPDENGLITQNEIMNKPGTAYLAISYYAFGEGGSTG